MHIAVAILVLSVLILGHELGHFLAGKMAGIKVKEFGVGFGPVIASMFRRGTVYSLRMLPFGAFVRFAGFNPDEGDLDDPRGFMKKPLRWRAWVLAAGPLMNLLIAAAIFTVIAAFIGVEVPTLRVGNVLEGFPAEAAGMLPGDQIKAIDGRPISSWDDLLETVGRSAGRELTFTVSRDGRRLDIQVTVAPHPDVPSKGFVGISPATVARRFPALGALAVGLRHTREVSDMWVRGLVLTVMRRVAPDVAGPVGITYLLGQASRTGLGNLLYIAGALSANLGLINLLPIPALDGSRLLFVGFEAVRGRPVDPRKENFVHLVGFAMLIVLGLLITVHDIVRLGAVS